MSLLNFRMVQSGDASELLAYYQRNEAFFKPWEPTRPPEFNRQGYWVEQVALRELLQIEKSAAYWVAENSYDGQIVAHCSLTNIIRGVFLSGYMGYAIDERYQAKGLMKKLCLSVIDHAFNDFKLNRVMANHMPANKRSAALLKKLGFEREGYAKRYLKINGRWEDHVLNALVNPASCFTAAED